jgi:hypothetical protein
MSLRRITFGSFLFGTAVLFAACDDPFALQPAVVPNFVDTVSVFALRGTPIGAPSGYDVAGRKVARTERGEPFDITYDIDSLGRSTISPQGALGLGRSSGILLSDKAFTRIEEAPIDGYILDKAVVVSKDAVFVVRSRAFEGSFAGSGDDCPFFIGALPRYGKFRVINANCGYRGLEPGLPRK